MNKTRTKEEILNMMKKTLKKYWGHDEFRGNQEKAIFDLLSNKNISYIEKTGAGKSIVYQMSALVKKGLTIIVSPLKSLMRDQVKNLEKKGISATFINSDLSEEEKHLRLNGLMKGKYKMLYVSPERLSGKGFLRQLIKVPGGIQYFILDEFDTVEEYGNTGFRPEFLKLGKIKKELEKGIGKRIPVGIFTATAKKETINAVASMMLNDEETKNMKFYQGKLVGNKLSIEIHKYDNSKEKDKYFYSYITIISKELEKNKKNKQKGSAIIFCTTTKDVDNIYKILKFLNSKVGKYHGKMTANLKESTYNKFIKNKIDFVVCTNAFGRGIDKSDIRYILHYGTPQNVSSYMQEIGRGGRDGKKYKAILLYCNNDINKRKFILRGNRNGDELLEEYENFLNFLDNKVDCRIKLLHEYFGFNVDECDFKNEDLDSIKKDDLKIKNGCGICDNCNPGNNLKICNTELLKSKKQIEKNKKIIGKQKNKRKKKK